MISNQVGPIVVDTKDNELFENNLKESLNTPKADNFSFFNNNFMKENISHIITEAKSTSKFINEIKQPEKTISLNENSSKISNENKTLKNKFTDNIENIFIPSGHLLGNMANNTSNNKPSNQAFEDKIFEEEKIIKNSPTKLIRKDEVFVNNLSSISRDVDKGGFNKVIPLKTGEDLPITTFPLSNIKKSEVYSHQTISINQQQINTSIKKSSNDKIVNVGEKEIIKETIPDLNKQQDSEKSENNKITFLKSDLNPKEKKKEREILEKSNSFINKEMNISKSNKYLNYNSQHMAYSLIRDISSKRGMISSSFLIRMEDDISRRHSKEKILNEIIETKKPKLRENDKLQTFNRLIIDANRRINKYAKILESQSGEKVKENPGRVYREKEWEKIYEERFLKFEQTKENKRKIKSKEKLMNQKQFEDKILENPNLNKKANIKQINEYCKRLYDEAEKRRVKIEQIKFKKEDEFEIFVEHHKKRKNNENKKINFKNNVKNN